MSPSPGSTRTWNGIRNIGCARNFTGAVDQGDNCAIHQVPVTDCHGNHWLNIQEGSLTIWRSKVEDEFEWNTNQRTDGVLDFRTQIIPTLFLSRSRGSPS